MILAHADQSATQRIDHAIRVAQRGLGRDRPRRVAGLVAIETLIGEVREVDGAVMQRIRSAAIFVNARADVEPLRSDVNGTSRGPFHDHVPPTFERAPFEPVNVAAVNLDLIEPQRAGSDARCGQRRRPRTVGRHDRYCL